MADTAIIEATVAAAETEGTPLLEEGPETADLELAPESDGLELPETEEPDDPYAGLTPREAAEKAREEVRREAEASKTESLRRQRESIETEQRQRAAEAAAMVVLRENNERASETYRTSARKKVQAWLNGDAEATEDEIGSLVTDLDTGAMHRASTALAQGGGAYLQGFGVQAMNSEVQAAYWRAYAAGDINGMFRAFAETARAVGYAQGQQAADGARTAAEEKENAETAAARQLRETRARSANGAQPTQVRGQGGNRVDNRTVLQTAHPLSPEYARAFVAEHPGVPIPTP